MLNNIIKDWQKEDLLLWKEKEAAVFLQPSRRVYTLGNQTNFVCAADDVPVADNTVYATSEDWVATTTTAAAAAGQAVINITSLTSYQGVPFNTSCTTYVGVENEDGDLQWSTISSISTLQITLAANLTAAVESGASVYLYRTTLDKPLKILDDNVRLWQKGGTEIPVTLRSYTDYNNMPQKNTSGTPVQCFYRPKVDTGELTLWPTSNTVDNVLIFRYMSEIDVFDGTATQDFPNEWIRALGWALASELAIDRGLPVQRQQQLDMRASSLKEDLLDWNQDNSPLFLQPDMSQYR
jgi:hypothetical protein